jgi:hypothetical protein
MYFSSIESVLVDVDGSGNLDAIKNLTSRAKVSEALLSSSVYYETVTVADGERPDILSKRLYNDERYHWTFLLLNPQIKNIWDDWPMSSSQLIDYCTNKYQYLAADTDDDLNNKFILGETVQGGVSGALGTVKEIHVNLGYITIEKTSGTFSVTGETINGLNSQDSVACNFVKSQAYAPHHHRNTSGVRVNRSNVTVPYTMIDYESAVTEQNRQVKVIKTEHINTISAAFIQAMS